MEEKKLGKIKSAKFGLLEDRQFLMGLQLEFEMEYTGCGDGGLFLFNISDRNENTKWSEQERTDVVMENMNLLKEILTDSKVNTVNELIGKPVEVLLKNRCFQDFRILTEVL